MDVIELRALFLGGLIAIATTTVLLGQAATWLVGRWRSRRVRPGTRVRAPHTVGTA
jgi:hypothetical protein